MKSNPYDSRSGGRSVKRVLHARFVKWCTRRLLLTFTIGSASWGTLDAPFFIHHSRKKLCWARRIFHLACRWTSTGTDELSKTAFTAAGSDLEQLLEQITKPTFHIRDLQDLKMVDGEAEMSSYKQSQKCLSDLIMLHHSIVIWSPESSLKG